MKGSNSGSSVRPSVPSKKHLPLKNLLRSVLLHDPLGVHLKWSGSEKGVFWKRGLFRKVHSLEILENLEILEILKNPQTLENKGQPRDVRDSLSEKRPLKAVEAQA